MRTETDAPSLESLWQMYRSNLHGYDPDAEAELEAAFKSGVWALLQMQKAVARDYSYGEQRRIYEQIQTDFETLKAKRRDQ